MAGDDYCYLTTKGRRTGKPHRIEIWYERSGDTVYLLAGGAWSSDWVRNLQAEPSVTVELDEQLHPARGRALIPGSDEDATARRLLFDKYQPRYDGDLASWRESALPVALDLTG